MHVAPTGHVAFGDLLVGMRVPWQQGDYIQTFICGFIYFIFHLHAPRASATRALLAPERSARVEAQLSLRGSGHVRCSTSCLIFKGFCVSLSASRCSLFRLKCSTGRCLLGGMSGEGDGTVRLDSGHNVIESRQKWEKRTPVRTDDFTLLVRNI